jgi:hypothetical protein
LTFDAFAWIRDVRGAPLGVTGKVVALMLASRADETGTAWPSLATLATDCGLSVGGVRLGLQELRKRGVVSVTSGQVGRESNRYRLNPSTRWTTQPAAPVHVVTPSPVVRVHVVSEPLHVVKEGGTPGDNDLPSTSAQELPIVPPAVPAAAAPKAKRENRRTPRTPAPDAETFVPNEATRRCAIEVGADLKRETVACFDHHRGKGNLMADWQATLRTWLRSPLRTTQRGPSGPNQPPPPGFIDHNRRPESRRLDLPERRGGVGLAFGGTKT